MQPPQESDLGRLLTQMQRILGACRKGLNHDLTNQVVALQGFLQLLNSEESKNLGPVGQDYVRRMLGVAQRTQALVRTLGDLSRLGADAVPPPEVLALPELTEEARATLSPPPTCSCQWQAPCVFAPRYPVLQALTVVFRLLTETQEDSSTCLTMAANPSEIGVELTIGAGLDRAIVPPNASPLSQVASLPKTWHDRLECVLLQELAECWGGTVHWQARVAGKAVTMNLPAPR
jgi:signal transduction histidine kinase